MLAKTVISIGIKLFGVSFPAPEPIASGEDVVFHFLGVHQDSDLLADVQGKDYRLQSLEATKSRLRAQTPSLLAYVPIRCIAIYLHHE